MNVEDLLRPVAGDKPCGEDFTYHPSFQSLETLARGKPETQFSAAEEPDWKEVRDAAVEVLNQSKHLSAAVLLAQALLKIDGLEGFRDGMAVLRGLTETYWPDLFPKLDPEDNNDPTERLNILNQLSSPKFNALVGDLVVCSSPSMGRVTLRQILDAKDKVDKGGEGSSGGGPDLKQIQAAFRDAGPDAARATLTLVEATLGHSQAIESFLDTTLGAGRGVNFDTLNKSLQEMKRAVEPHAITEVPADEAAPAAAEGSEVGSPAGVVASRGPRMSGTIQSRADVLKALDLICDFYRQNEPSSPVPLILQRAHRLVDKDFLSIMTDLTPDALQQLQVITGKSDK